MVVTTNMIRPITNATHWKEWVLTKYAYMVQLKQKDKKLKHYSEMFKITIMSWRKWKRYIVAYNEHVEKKTKYN
jgi:hypothetical protein